MPNRRHRPVQQSEPSSGEPMLEPMIERIGPLQPGDVLVFRDFDDSQHHEIIETVFAHYRSIADATKDLPTLAAFHIPLLVFLSADQTIEQVDEATMREHGWVRLDAPDGLPHSPEFRDDGR